MEVAAAILCGSAVVFWLGYMVGQSSVEVIRVDPWEDDNQERLTQLQTNLEKKIKEANALAPISRPAETEATVGQSSSDWRAHEVTAAAERWSTGAAGHHTCTCALCEDLLEKVTGISTQQLIEENR